MFTGIVEEVGHIAQIGSPDKNQQGENRRITINDLQAAKRAGERWSMLTAYDYSTARVFDEAGIPVLLVGDSAANVVYGYDSTVPITMDELLPLVRAVARGSKRAFLLTDLPFGSYQESPQQAFRSAAELMAAGAQMVKLEGGAEFVETVRFLTRRGVPVCGHLGLTPQSVHKFGGYRVQGKGEDAEQKLIEEAPAPDLAPDRPGIGRAA